MDAPFPNVEEKMNSATLVEVAKDTALRAGHLLIDGFGSSLEISSKSTQHDLVTQYDRASEELIINSIKERFPNHSFLAEESGGNTDEEYEVLWIIDPLDGTSNFAHQVPIFSVSIAACVDGQVLAGVVYQPMTDELFHAEKGKGAFLNDRLITVTERDDFSRAMFVTGFPPDTEKNPGGCIDHFVRMLKQGAPIRRLGSAALDLAYVAAGRFDAFWEIQLSPWDIAAGSLLVTEAGGIVTDYSGETRDLFSYGNILASNDKLHNLVREQLQ